MKIEIIRRIGVVDVEHFEVAGLVRPLLDERGNLRRQARAGVVGKSHAQKLGGVGVDQRRQLVVTLPGDTKQFGQALAAL